MLNVVAFLFARGISDDLLIQPGPLLVTFLHASPYVGRR
jgi:hypothetical protein